MRTIITIVAIAVMTPITVQFAFDMLVSGPAEQERILAEQAERDRIARELATEQAERERIERELATEQAERERIERELATEQAEREAEDIVARTGWVGIGFQALGEDSPVPGVLVTEVMPCSPAETAGIQVGDAVLEIDSRSFSSTQEFVETIRASPPGRRLIFTIFRDQEGQEGFTTPVNVMSRASYIDLSDTLGLGLFTEEFQGIRLTSVRQFHLGHYNLPAGTVGVVVLGLEENSNTWNFLSEGDVFLTVDGDPVSTPSQFSEAVENRKSNSTQIEFLRDGQVRQINLVSEPLDFYMRE